MPFNSGSMSVAVWLHLIIWPSACLSASLSVYLCICPSVCEDVWVNSCWSEIWGTCLPICHWRFLYCWSAYICLCACVFVCVGIVVDQGLGEHVYQSVIGGSCAAGLEVLRQPTWHRQFILSDVFICVSDLKCLCSFCAVLVGWIGVGE